MPKYQYACDKCSTKPRNFKDSDIYDSDAMKPGFHPRTGEYIFFVECKMNDKPKKPTCPKCKSNKEVNSNYTDLDLQCYVRGNGLVKDKAGAKRDMHRHKLKHEDPYSSMRVSGEVDYLSDKFRRGGMDLSAKSNTDSIKISQEKRANEVRREADSLNEIEKNIIIHIFKKDRGVGSTTTELSQYSDDINKHLTKLNNNYVYYDAKKEIWMPLAGGNRIYETLAGI
jgi:hypothetical protein